MWACPGGSIVLLLLLHFLCSDSLELDNQSDWSLPSADSDTNSHRHYLSCQSSDEFKLLPCCVINVLFGTSVGTWLVENTIMGCRRGFWKREKGGEASSAGEAEGDIKTRTFSRYYLYTFPVLTLKCLYEIFCRHWYYEQLMADELKYGNNFKTSKQLRLKSIRMYVINPNSWADDVSCITNRDKDKLCLNLWWQDGMLHQQKLLFHQTQPQVNIGFRLPQSHQLPI